MYRGVGIKRRRQIGIFKNARNVAMGIKKEVILLMVMRTNYEVCMALCRRLPLHTPARRTNKHQPLYIGGLPLHTPARRNNKHQPLYIGRLPLHTPARRNNKHQPLYIGGLPLHTPARRNNKHQPLYIVPHRK